MHQWVNPNAHQAVEGWSHLAGQRAQECQHSSKDGCDQERGGEVETKEESKELSTHQALFPVGLSWKVREADKGVVSAAECLSLPKVLGPQGWAGLCTWGCPGIKSHHGQGQGALLP